MRKICPHIERGTSVAIGSPPVVKLVNVSVQYMREIRAAHPDALIDVRWVQPRDYQPLDDPTRWAREFFEHYLQDMVAMTDEGRDTQIVFEGYNEVGDKHAEAYAEFEVERLTSMHVVGLRSVVGNWSVGCPDFGVWQTYQPVLDAMRKGDVVGLHEYWVNEADLRDGGHWHAGRFSLVPEIQDKQIIITECGRDRVEHIGHAGWRGHCSAEQFLRELRMYDDLLCQYPNVLGATVYTMGQYADQWRDFDVAPIWPQVVAEQESVCAIPAPTEMPIPGARISQPFGMNQEYYSRWGLDGHNGVDLAAPNPDHVWDWHGMPVLSVSTGRVVIGRSDGYGLYVYVYSDDADWLYAHLAAAAVGHQQVEAGQTIGYVGYSGNTLPPGIRGTHLHWGKRPKPYRWANGFNGYVDPMG